MKKPSGESFPQIEERVLKFWKKAEIFDKSLEQRKNAPRFSFYDGPPFATGLPHYGHILAMTIKDVVTRYKTMQGFYVPRRNGWDCHGLPVEYELEKELGIKTKSDIEKMGVDVFNKKAREIVLRYVDEWTETMGRMGRWIDTKNAYTSMSNDYIESVWWVFKQIWDKGLVYKDFRVSPYCPRCGTALSNFEVTQGYKEVGDESVFVRFKLSDKDKLLNSIGDFNRLIKDKPIYFLVWTTTPWTLPGNVALAAGEDIEYFIAHNNREVLIIAKDRLGSVLEEGDSYSVLSEVLPGSKMEGWQYEGLYPQSTNLLKDDEQEKLYKVQTADFVSTEDGTGIVHIAPAFGEDDMSLAREKDLPSLMTVDLAGAVISGYDLPGQGAFVKEADKDIKADLKERGLLYKEERITHAYPFCWRCETPLIYYALPSWYVAVSEIREKLVKNNKDIHWVPGHIKEGRFGKWLEGARDWAISRSRYWGAPIPVWICENCDEMKAIGSKEELGLAEDFDLHKPQIDGVTLKCEKCGGIMRRVPEVFDCWFESGSMPYAQWHYPFEHKEEFETGFPADFIAEGLDQTRGWFYTMHVLATILYDKPAYKNVVVNGLVLAQDGRKLSKRLRNYVEPSSVFDTIGVDGLRYFLLASTPIGEDYRFSEGAVREQVRKYILPMWNSYNYLATYAPLAGWSHESLSTPLEVKGTILDKWMESRMQLAIKDVTKWMDKYELTKAARALNDLVNDLSTWYIRRSRKRQDKEFYSTLYGVLKSLAKLTAPFTPFIAEELYQNLKEDSSHFAEASRDKEPESVHLADYPKVEENKIDKNLLEKMELARNIVEIGHALRAEGGVKVRQPLGSLGLSPSTLLRVGVEGLGLSDELVTLVLEELNVKKIVSLDSLKGKEQVREKTEKGVTVILDLEITDKLKKEGMVREMMRQIQDLRREAGYKPGEKVVLYYQTGSKEISELMNEVKDVLEKETCVKLELGLVEGLDAQKEIKLDGEVVEIGVRKI